MSEELKEKVNEEPDNDKVKAYRRIDDYLNTELNKAEKADDGELMVRLYRAIIAFRRTL